MIKNDKESKKWVHHLFYVRPGVDVLFGQYKVQSTLYFFFGYNVGSIRNTFQQLNLISVVNFERPMNYNLSNFKNFVKLFNCSRMSASGILKLVS